MRKRIITFITLLLFSSWPISGLAQSSGLDFLNIGPNTRSLSLGEAVTALPMGGSAIYTNPANLAFDRTSTLTADYSLWVADLYNSHIAVNLKQNNNQSLAFGLLNSTSGSFEVRTAPGPSDGSFSVNYLSLSGAYAWSLKNISVGAAAHYIREEYFINNASGYSLNFGISSHWLEERLRVGTSLLSVGKMNKLRDEATELPTNLRAGVIAELFQFIPPKNEELPILVTFYGDYINLWEEVNSNGSNSFFNFGLSFNVATLVEVRGGYKIGDTDRNFSVGVGINTESLSFNYSMIPFETGFGTAHSIGIEYYF
ncbi:PorV/PorQ family protein [Aliifodinibius sp. S!AR15-10]|uniref:PorV/PorQ family protein n=1 Tax=Aliifodinibius sp. S!AR15-10 TaxID=2950437 RepID=UPI002866FE13|nr:PorV/PorQ family protein [Aliifodinibius sp. S!AR15-10]MDR8392341.1 PorV/PorQ family protein [Aliifodinibius sp. S!AR15-10]